MIQALALAGALSGNPAAQSDFRRGLALYYAYNGADGKHYFRKALDEDPHFAMAAWGIALSEGPDLNTELTPATFASAAQATHQMLALEGYASPTERAYIDAMARRYHGTWRDKASDESSYRAAMTRLANANPTDTDAQVLATETFIEDGRRDRARSLIDRAMKSDPTNVMLNHLCIHAYDDVASRTPAVSCAYRLDQLEFSPQEEHLAHMPAHTWVEVGEYAKAVASSERALALFDRLLEREPSTPHRRYIKHDTYVGYAASMMTGDYATALQLAKRADAVYDEHFEAATALRFGRDRDALAYASNTTTSGQIVRAYIAASAGDIASATGLIDNLSGDLATGAFADLAQARLAEAKGDEHTALRDYDAAQSEQHDNYSDELLPLFPAETERGAFYLRRREYKKAEAVFEKALARYPNDPRALYGLAQCLTAMNEPGRAAVATARFNHAWIGADTTLTIESL